MPNASNDTHLCDVCGQQPAQLSNNKCCDCHCERLMQPPEFDGVTYEQWLKQQHS